jgi:hypothetical protein
MGGNQVCYQGRGWQGMFEQWASVDEASDFQGQQVVELMF